MRKTLYLIFALSLFTISCTERLKTSGDVPADCIMLNIFNSPMTKAVDWQGADYERELNRLDCFFYVKGRTDESCVYYQKVLVDEIGSANIPLYVDELIINDIFPSGDECDVFVIANLTSGTFEKGMTGTDVPTLSKTILTLDGNRDAIDKPFIMQGLDVATKGDNNNASGTIPLHRAAAKITVTVNIPEQIVIDYNDADDITMTPIFTDNDSVITLKSSFHYGVKKTYLRDDYSSLLVNEDALHVGKRNYIYVGEVSAVGNTPTKYTYTCEVPFYTYARAWDKGAQDAAYLTFEMPWTNVSDPSNPVTKTYYYQILINGNGRCFKPNNWYDIVVNVGVIGSTIESEPVTIEDITYYVLDWTTEPESDSGDRYENVNIEDYTYLQVPEKYIVMNNTTIGELKFDASHNVKWSMEWPEDQDVVNLLDQLEKDYNGTKKHFAYYIDCGENPPVASSLQNYISIGNFSLSQSKKTIQFNYPKDNIAVSEPNIYSPVYVHLKVWLDIDGTGDQPNGIEENFVEYVTFVYYPPMYVVPDKSVEHSVFINGYNQYSDPITYNNGRYHLGRATGEGAGEYMYNITVSSFGVNDIFTINGTDYNYIIGDPRVKTSDTNLNNDGFSMNNSWDKDQERAGKILTYYYPTSTNKDIFRVVSPKFKVASFLGSHSNGSTPEGAAMRCASYQEDGYPAGRWRLPTTAEVLFVISLQQKGVIQPIFYGGNYYYSTTHQVQNQATIDIREFNMGDNSTATSNVTGSVRCIYDEWFWGSQREARSNNSYPGGYEFTWGDKRIW